MKRFLITLGVTMMIASSALALTPDERKIIQAAQTQIEAAMVDYKAAQQALVDAQNEAATAEQHAADTDRAAGTLKQEVDAAYTREKALATDNAKMKPVYDEVRKYWGLGAIFYGIKELLKHLIIAAIVIVILIVGVLVLSFFFPLIGTILSFIVQGFTALIAMIGALFKPKPPTPPAPPAPPTPPTPTPTPPGSSIS